MGWDKLLTGKTGDAIITADTPPWLDTLVYRNPARRVIRNQVFKFCGVTPRKIIQIGSVKLAKPGEFEKWINQANHMGQNVAA